MNVTLKNKTGRAKVIVLDHAAFRTKAYGFRRRQQLFRAQAKDGSIATKTITREEPGSITLPPNGEVNGLHPAIKNCSQVRNLLALGAIAIVPDDTPTAVTTAQRAPKRRAPKASATSTVTASSEAAGKGDA